MTEAAGVEAAVVDVVDVVDEAEAGGEAGDETENRSSHRACVHYD